MYKTDGKVKNFLKSLVRAESGNRFFTWLGNVFFTHRKSTVSCFAGTILLGHLLFMSSCVSPITGGTGEKINGFILQKIEIENARFEPTGLRLSITPASTYWIKRGNLFAPKWDTFEFHFEKEGEMCTFPNNRSSAACLVCDFCNLPSNLNGPPCLGIHPIFNNGFIQAVADPSFVQTDDPETVLSYAGTPEPIFGTCGTPRFQQPKFEPKRSALYRIMPAAGERFV
ncbi:MAG: hypothetical protein HKN25_06680, partial [Pyrinomonadaceae bacterium]|nr:hypothetical protein [Pyrinomonadaceae bacterium]